MWHRNWKKNPTIHLADINSGRCRWTNERYSRGLNKKKIKVLPSQYIFFDFFFSVFSLIYNIGWRLDGWDPSVKPSVWVISASQQPAQSEIFKEKEARLWAGLSCDKCEEAFKRWWPQKDLCGCCNSDSFIRTGWHLGSDNDTKSFSLWKRLISSSCSCLALARDWYWLALVECDRTFIQIPSNRFHKISSRVSS